MTNSILLAHIINQTIHFYIINPRWVDQAIEQEHDLCLSRAAAPAHVCGVVYIAVFVVDLIGGAVGVVNRHCIQVNGIISLHLLHWT